MSDWIIEGGEVLGEAGLAPGALGLTGGKIGTPPAPRRFDAAGCWVLPGIIDIHGDAHERGLQPRPGVGFPPGFALEESARQMLGCGITTAYLGVTLSWEPGLRSLQMFRDLLKAPRPEGPDMRIHLRMELDNFDALPDAVAAIGLGRVHLLGFNDHTPSISKHAAESVKLAKFADRAGVPAAQIHGMAAAAMARRDAELVPAREALASAARAAGIPMLSHDDNTLERRQMFRDLGATICEFPVVEEVALDAQARGEHVVMGAPNVVRGGSHLGWASAAPLAEQGVVTILASDYHWPALFMAPFAMMRRGVLDVAQSWELVSANPADALGLTDRGRLAPGMRGDVVIVEGGKEAPKPVAVFTQGRLSWVAPGAAARM
ncbi:alpha-D-ribose 1-methylphosphonate 5-triphosphate diphosphatase [Rhodovarius crocodyli]|uniref:Alpha-D-ribose 1-methylphosphonate 5-triphosphate diphosphatase n=1 Tax=Rhodovarius crocodyli TaxID=1979269 RepID=A0A437MCT2_9PROT|nr:alpha-D-ribose 1-methylphosphonate 5-triphosphate diphosphatase [Rhodovarius crocodyli]RVT95447.1 alpha-D-ribose 1-methylphosphonate 5-triphosphate diphosphatase [Rhodovarius crocodyli]